MDPNQPFRDSALGRALLAELTRLASELPAEAPFRFMEVCGTHTVSLFRSGIRGLLPANIHHVSGPGCPVCVTHDRELAALIALASQPDLVLASFGDMLRVPGPDGRSLKHAQAEGAHILMVYSPLDALEYAVLHPDKLVVFAAVGFETTAPSVAATVLAARKRAVSNFCIFCCHKRIEPALRLLLTGSAQQREGNPEHEERAVHDGVRAKHSELYAEPSLIRDAERGKVGTEHGLSERNAPRGLPIDALLLPGHVAAVTGLAPFAFIPSTGRAAVVAGFEAVEILAALVLMVRQHCEARQLCLPDFSLASASPLTNAYGRAVSSVGNVKALAVLNEVFVPADAAWRGLGVIEAGGLRVRSEFASFDAVARLELELPDVDPPLGCRCGDVLRGQLAPSGCPLFGTVCSPASPVGPCMVSSEGSCAAWYLYGGM